MINSVVSVISHSRFHCPYSSLIAITLAATLSGCGGGENGVTAAQTHAAAEPTTQRTDTQIRTAPESTMPDTDARSQSEMEPNTVNNPQTLFGGRSCAFSAEAVTTVPTTLNGVPLSPTETVSPVATDSENHVDCDEELGELPGPGVSHTGVGSLLTDSSEITISSVTADSESVTGNFSVLELILHDGETRSLVQQSKIGGQTTIRIDWAIYNISVAMTANLTQAGADTFSGGTFEVSNSTDLSATEFEQSNYALGVWLFIDKRDDGIPTTEDEVAQAVSGNINVSGAAPDWLVTLDLTLDDGSSLTGSYSGSFYQVPAQER